MRWLWQYGMRWASSQIWSQAKQRATDSLGGDASEGGSADEVQPVETAMAVLCETKRLYDAVADGLSQQRTVEGNQFVLCKGKLAGSWVVVTRPTGDAPNPLHLVTALVDGHRPRFALAAAEGSSLSDQVSPGSIVVASRVLDASGHALRLDGTAPEADGYFTGVVATSGATEEAAKPDAMVAASNVPMAEDRWSEPVARACQQVGLAMIAASVVLQPTAAQRSAETASLKKQSSLAGQAGVLTGMLFKKRSGIRDLWNEKEAAWDGCSRLANLAKHLAQSANG